jgi:hypothetical protein
MSNFAPVNPPRNFSVEENSNSLKVTTGTSTRTKRTIYVVLAFFLLMMLGSLLFVIFAFVKNSYFDGFILIMPLIMGVGTLSLFTKISENIMEITDSDVTIFEGASNFWRSNKYDIAHIKNLRGSMRTFPREKEGAIKFDYGSQTIVFGKWLTEAEANLIVQAIVKKYPRLKNSLG